MPPQQEVLTIELDHSEFLGAGVRAILLAFAVVEEPDDLQRRGSTALKLTKLYDKLGNAIDNWLKAADDGPNLIVDATPWLLAHDLPRGDRGTTGSCVDVLPRTEYSSGGMPRRSDISAADITSLPIPK